MNTTAQADFWSQNAAVVFFQFPPNLLRTSFHIHQRDSHKPQQRFRTAVRSLLIGKYLALTLPSIAKYSSSLSFWFPYRESQSTFILISKRHPPPQTSSHPFGALLTSLPLTAFFPIPSYTAQLSPTRHFPPASFCQKKLVPASSFFASFFFFSHYLFVYLFHFSTTSSAPFDSLFVLPTISHEQR